MTPALRLRHLGGGLSTRAGPITLSQARALANDVRDWLADADGAIAEAERWRRAAGWIDLDAADRGPARDPGP